MLSTILELAVFGFGAFAVLFAASNCWRFSQIPKRLSRAFALNLFGEMLAGGLTLGFGIAQAFEFMMELTPETQNVIRIVLLVGLLIPSWQLKRIIWQIEHEE